MQIGWRRGLALTLCGGPLFIACATGGYLFAQLPHGAVIQPGSAVIAGLVLSHFASGQGTSRTTWFGAILIIVGLVAANLGGNSRVFANAWIGDLLFVTAGVLWACFTVLLKRWQIDPVTGTCVVSVLALLVTAPLYGAFEGFARLGTIATSQLVLQFTMQGLLAGFLAVVAFVKAVQLLGSARASLLPALVPVCAMLIGVPITGERPALLQLCGLAIVTLGLLLALGATRLLSTAGRRS
jgi:drug/metabolite transporter (DMT)-like permease